MRKSKSKSEKEKEKKMGRQNVFRKRKCRKVMGREK